MNKTLEFKSNKLSKKQTRKKPRRPRSGAATRPTGRTANADLAFRTPLFPPRFTKRLIYCETGLTISATAPLANTYFFTANGMFDPNITGTGHQPMGFDEMMLMYEQYTVVSSKISVHLINASGAGLTCAAGVYLSPDTTQITVPSRLLENGYLKWDLLAPIGVLGYLKTMNLDCDMSSYFARNKSKRELVDDVNLFGTSAANPTEQVYFGIVLFDPTGLSNTVLYFVVTVEYEAIFWEPKKLTQS